MPISSPKVDHHSSMYEMKHSKVSNEEFEVIRLRHRYTVAFVSRKTFVSETWLLKLFLETVFHLLLFLHTTYFPLDPPLSTWPLALLLCEILRAPHHSRSPDAGYVPLHHQTSTSTRVSSYPSFTQAVMSIPLCRWIPSSFPIFCNLQMYLHW